MSNSYFDEDLYNEMNQSADEFNENQLAEEKRLKEEEQFELQQQEQRAAEVKDSHSAKDASEFGLKENLKEVQNALAGGVRDTASSILTAPERILDMATGEMAEQAKQ